MATNFREKLNAYWNNLSDDEKASVRRRFGNEKEYPVTEVGERMFDYFSKKHIASELRKSKPTSQGILTVPKKRQSNEAEIKVEWESQASTGFPIFCIA